MYESGHCFLTSQIFSGIHERQSPIHRKKNQTETICSTLSSGPQLFDVENFTKSGRAVRQWFIGKCISIRPQRCLLLIFSSRTPEETHNQIIVEQKWRKRIKEQIEYQIGTPGTTKDQIGSPRGLWEKMAWRTPKPIIWSSRHEDTCKFALGACCTVNSITCRVKS